MKRTRANQDRRIRTVLLPVFLLAITAFNWEPAGAATAPTTTAAYTYDAASNTPAMTPGVSMGVDTAMTTNRVRSGTTGGLCVASPDFVAADTAADLGPGIDKSFQFGKASRSGADVKNFVGPQNSVVRGASQGRVFVTDDQRTVVLDITRDRVKPVVPGQGFVTGDGRKLIPTQQQLDWIDPLWGK